MRIILTGGGTAGHAWPIILVAKSLIKNKRNQVLFVGSRQGVEKDLAQQNKIPFKKIFVGKRRVYFSFSNVWDLFKSFIGFIQVFFILLFFKPHVVFAKGGFVTAPMIFWLHIFKIPLVIHESDTVMGRANLLGVKIAKKICLGFPVECYKQKLPLEKVVYTGIPVNPEFMEVSIETGKRPKILITGGSQGSSKINNLIKEILPELIKKYEIWHLSGERDYKSLKEFKDSKLGDNACFYHLYSFSCQIPKFMRDSDLIISRAGASTLAEISSVGKAAIIIPLSTAANEHQEANAKVYFERNAAVILTEDKLTASSLKSIIDNLITDDEMKKLLGHHARSLFQKKSVEEIINTIFDTLNK